MFEPLWPSRPRVRGGCPARLRGARGGELVWTVRGEAVKQADMTDGGTENGAAGGRRGKAPVPVTAKASRDDRRKAALKANMARRKDQARLRAAQQRDEQCLLRGGTIAFAR